MRSGTSHPPNTRPTTTPKAQTPTPQSRFRVSIKAGAVHCTGAGGTVITPIKRRPDTELPDKHKKSNKAHAALRAPVEPTISRIKQWRIFRHAEISPNRLTSVAAAILTPVIYT
ncbi:transposase family protein [Streptomyces sp. NPDC052013]|uniref:transposase family protein n=1 Tax=Streptomyces sp. NPDC052013 TaxID=3365679 RepID=UPI0037D305F0